MTILGIPFKNFKEKIKIVQAYDKKGKVKILDNIVYIEIKEMN